MLSTSPKADPVIHMEFSRDFCAAHRLYNYEGKCHNIHGHNYHVDIVLSSTVNPESGLTVDYGDLKPIIDQLDHSLMLVEGDPLLDLLRGTDLSIAVFPCEPSTENVARLIAERIAEAVHSAQFHSTTVTVKETEHIIASAFVASPRFYEQVQPTPTPTSQVGAPARDRLQPDSSDSDL